MEGIDILLYASVVVAIAATVVAYIKTHSGHSHH